MNEYNIPACVGKFTVVDPRPVVKRLVHLDHERGIAHHTTVVYCPRGDCPTCLEVCVSVSVKVCVKVCVGVYVRVVVESICFYSCKYMLWYLLECV